MGMCNKFAKAVTWVWPNTGIRQKQSYKPQHDLASWHFRVFIQKYSMVGESTVQS